MKYSTFDDLGFRNNPCKIERVAVADDVQFFIMVGEVQLFNYSVTDATNPGSYMLVVCPRKVM